MTEDKPDPEAVVDAASIDAKDEAPQDNAQEKPKKRKRAPAVERPFPRKTLEDALRVPTAVRTHNGGKPYAPSEVAKALGLGMSGNFYYVTAASRDYGLTEGTRDAATISLTDLGRSAVYPKSDEELSQALLDAFFSVELFRKVVDHYGGSELPEDEFVRNTLESTPPVGQSGAVTVRSEWPGQGISYGKAHIVDRLGLGLDATAAAPGLS